MTSAIERTLDVSGRGVRMPSFSCSCPSLKKSMKANNWAKGKPSINTSQIKEILRKIPIDNKIYESILPSMWGKVELSG